MNQRVNKWHIIMIAAVVVIACVVMVPRHHGSSGSGSSGGSMQSQIAAATSATVASYSLVSNNANVVIHDQSNTSTADVIPMAQNDCYNAFEVLFKPASGVATATVTVDARTQDSLGNDSWTEAYQASLPIEVAAQVNWSNDSAAGLKTAWTVNYCVPDLAQYQ
jgi:hypothetical protein